MTPLLTNVANWWAGGDLLMPVLLGVALVLYAVIAERLWRLWHPSARIATRSAELHRLLAQHPDPAWAARYLATEEAEALARGRLLIATLTLCLPLLGLLGTVAGMTETFAALATGSAGRTAQDASRGIGLALTATQYGMALALPGMLGAWLVERRVAMLAHARDHAATGIIATRVPRTPTLAPAADDRIEDVRCSA